MFGSRIRQLASETAVYGVASVLGRMINFALVPFYTNVLPMDHYGVVILLYTSFVFLNIVYTYGMESAYLRFASGDEGRARQSDTFSVAVWSLLGSGLFLSMLLLAMRDQSAWLIGIQENWIDLIYFAVGILTLDVLAVIPMAELRLSSRPWRFAAARLLHVAVNVGLNLYLIIGLDMGIRAIFVANLAASGAVLLFLTPEFARYLRPRFDWALWKRLMRFGLPFVPGGLAYALSERVSLFFLGKMSKDQVLSLYGEQLDLAVLEAQAARAADAAAASLGPGPDAALAMADAAEQVYGHYIVSVFGTAYKLAILMMLAAQMFRYAWQPFFLNRADDPDAKELFARIFTLFTAAAMLLVLAVSFFAHELVSIPLPGGRTVIPVAYWLGLQIVPLALLGYVLQGWYYNFSVGVYLKKKTGYFVHATVVGGTVSVVLTAILVPKFGMVGAATATLVAFASLAGVLFIYSRRLYPIPYNWGRVGIVVGVAAVCFAAWYLVPMLQTWWIEVLILVAYVMVLHKTRIVTLRLR